MSLFSKKSVVATVISTVLTSVIMTSVAQAQEGPRLKRGVGERFAKRAFNRLDTSGDSLITLEEFTANTQIRAERGFNRKDADEDGLLSLEEATTNRRGEIRPDYSDLAEQIVACVAELAEDDDSIVVPDTGDFITPEERFNAADTSGDGALSLEEVQASALDRATSAFNVMDADASGDISLEEFQASGDSRRATRRAVRTCIEELDVDDMV